MSPTEKPGFFILLPDHHRRGDSWNPVHSRSFIQSMPGTGLNIIVCVDPRRCLSLRIKGRNSLELLQELRDLVIDQGLTGQVKSTPCQCIFGCTYGPRIDVINRDTGKKTLYGAVSGPVSISVRGKVAMKEIPDNLQDLIQQFLN